MRITYKTNITACMTPPVPEITFFCYLLQFYFSLVRNYYVITKLLKIDLNIIWSNKNKQNKEKIKIIF